MKLSQFFQNTPGSFSLSATSFSFSFAQVLCYFVTDNSDSVALGLGAFVLAKDEMSRAGTESASVS